MPRFHVHAARKDTGAELTLAVDLGASISLGFVDLADLTGVLDAWGTGCDA